MSDETKVSVVFGWRKFASFVLVIVVTAGLTWFSKIESQHFADVIFWAMAIFFASNVSNHIGSVFSKKLNVSISTEDK